MIDNHKVSASSIEAGVIGYDETERRWRLDVMSRALISVAGSYLCTVLEVASTVVSATDCALWMETGNHDPDANPLFTKEVRGIAAAISSGEVAIAVDGVKLTADVTVARLMQWARVAGLAKVRAAKANERVGAGTATYQARATEAEIARLKAAYLGIR